MQRVAQNNAKLHKQNVGGREMKPNEVTIISPVNGMAVPLEQVPDTVFADKVLGDGTAVIPADGIFLSPVDGEISSIAERRA